MKMRMTQIALIILGLACVGLGAYRGEMEEVMRKAIMICLECAGLG
ncbi:MAG: thioredoxin [Oscillospiraceae bacterium]|nr:thioredoxin [Oscillospiraceae bacterium]